MLQLRSYERKNSVDLRGYSSCRDRCWCIFVAKRSMAEQENSPTGSAPISNSTSLSAGFKTYQNPKYHWSVSYPENWPIIESRVGKDDPFPANESYQNVVFGSWTPEPGPGYVSIVFPSSNKWFDENETMQRICGLAADDRPTLRHYLCAATFTDRFDEHYFIPTTQGADADVEITFTTDSYEDSSFEETARRIVDSFRLNP